MLLYKGYGTENAAFCGVFDGHGKNGHVVSKIVNSRLSPLILSQKKVHAKIDTVQKGDKINHVDTDEDNSSAPNTNCHEWKEAILDAFRVMEKELKLQENIDSTCSGTTAVVVIRQVNKQTVKVLNIHRAKSCYSFSRVISNTHA